MRLVRQPFPILRLIASFVRTRLLARRLKTRADVEAWQRRRIRSWLRHTVSSKGYYRDRNVGELDDLPIVDKSIVMATFEQFNSAGVSSAEGWRLFNSNQQRDGYIIGASTGTSGNRGLFVITNAERYEWLGVMLGKLLPAFPFETARIALILPLHTALYDSANRTRRLNLEFFDLRRGVAAIAPEIVGFAPDTIIAPPKVLRWLAEQDHTLAPKRLFSAAEVLDPVDREAIERRYRTKLGEIYMATEGLLATSCAHGTLHLAEDVMHFELQPVPDSDLVSPVVSDFTRRTQVVARYRMNDLLRMRTGACSCGSPLRAVAEVIGRCDDIFELPRTPGARSVLVTPDVLRNAILDSDRSITDFRLLQTGPDELQLILPDTVSPSAVIAAEMALARLLQKLGTQPHISTERRILLPPAVKLRRVERRWHASRSSE
ncbi:F390 synthetase-related protein [Rhizobium lusitanum]|uniref:Putative adenylate-forming enzyme n=1 Tax=Rhizobium lusitanum TaxID=293958 RepID=A0A7X0ITB4_9HYPH|nr:F390 synthetase-related protein [Rhizobium lusitanum]MBB6486798.1 putative adenylate-forming enzyme [Rhizobium lusitanum]